MSDNYELEALDLLKKNQELITKLEKKNKTLAETIAEQEVELETWDRVSNSDEWLEMSSIAKLLNYKELGRNKIFRLLRELEILRYNNEPYQRFVDNGCFKIIEQRVDLPYGDTKINLKTVVSQKGLDYIRKVLDEYYN